jgi:hypothetical protein
MSVPTQSDFGMTLSTVLNDNGTVTLYATNVSGAPVGYKHLHIATGANIRYFNGKSFVHGLTAVPANPVTLLVPASGKFSASMTPVALATFTPSTSPDVYDGGSITFASAPDEVIALAVQPPYESSLPLLPGWAGVTFFLVLFGAALLTWRRRREAV